MQTAFSFRGCILIFIRILTLVRCVAQHFWPLAHVMCAMCIEHRASCIFGVWTMYEVPDRKESIYTNAQWTFHFHFDSMYVYMQRSLVVVVVIVVDAVATATTTATATDAVACFFSLLVFYFVFISRIRMSFPLFSIRYFSSCFFHILPLSMVLFFVLFSVSCCNNFYRKSRHQRQS